MSLLDGLNRLKARFEEAGRAEAEDALNAGLSLTAAMKSRVQQEGLNSEEKPFEDYTPQYAKRRAKDGYQVGYVDFTRTNQTLGSTGPAIVEASPGRVVVEIKPRTAEGQLRVNGAFAKRGSIIANTPEEINAAGQEYATRQANRIV